MTAIRLGMAATAEADTAWFWVQEFGPIHFRGNVIDCDADVDDIDRHKLTADTAEKSLREWYAHYQPALIREHEHVGHSFGVATGKTRRLTPLQMRALITPGMKPEHAAKLRDQRRDVFFAEFRLTDPETLRQHARAQLLYTSPHVQLGHTDNTGRRWSLVHRENSLTTGPVQTSQVPIPALASVRLSQNKADPMTQTEDAPTPIAEDEDEPTLATEDRMTALEDQIAALAADLAECRAMVECATMGDTDDEPDQPTDEIAELRASLAAAESTIATITAEKRRNEAAVEVATLSLSDAARAELVELAASNPDGYALSIRHVPPMAATQPTGDLVGPGVVIAPTNTDTPAGEHAAILSIQSAAAKLGAKLSYTEARTKLARTEA